MKDPKPTAIQTLQVAFGGHETFVMRYSWLKKAVDAVSLNSSIFGSDDALSELGVGKNMVRSIRHWGLASTVLEEVAKTRGSELNVSQFGQLLFGSQGLDPYLEDVGTLWLLHWKLANNERKATTWCWILNHCSATQFTREAIINFLGDELRKRALPSPSTDTLNRDVDCFIRSYTPARLTKSTVLEDTLDSPLAELGLIRSDRSSELLVFARGEKPSLPDSIFLYAVLEFWEKSAGQRGTLAFSELAYGNGSPGTIFRLDENSLTARLERLERFTRGALVYGDTAGLKQVYKRSPVRIVSVLSDHYGVSNQSLTRMGA